MFHQKRASERLQRETKRLKRMRSADKMVRSQALWNADSGRRHFNLRLPFHIDSPTFVHLSQFRFNISFSKFRWLIPLCIWFSSISMILQHQDINLVPFIMLPGNRSELNLVRWKDINKNKKTKTIICHYWCRTCVWSFWYLATEGFQRLSMIFQ